MLGLRATMRAAIAIAVSVLCGCAAPARQTQLASSTRSDSLCWWREAAWGEGVVFARHSVTKLGRVRSLPGQPVTATATLRRAGDFTLLEGRWSGPGLDLDGDVDLGNEPAIASWDPRRVGEVGLLHKGARLRVLDANVGSVLAVPGEASLALFHSNEPLAVTLRCEDLSVHGRSDSPSAQVRAAGFADDKALQLVGDAVELSATIDAPPAGVLDASRVPVLFELERSGAFVRVAVPTADNLTWIGWVDAARVKPAEAVAAPAAEGPTPPTEQLNACDEALPLAAFVDGRLQRVGTLRERAEFVVGAGPHEPDWLEVRLALEWFEPDVKLYLPRRASGCPASTRL